MLVLSRKKGEGLRIGNNITITIVEVRGDKVRIGIDAPRDVAVHRNEVAEAIAKALLADGEVTRNVSAHSESSPEVATSPVPPTGS
jgi:carbon storage regulator